jgi:hypothetical protein
MDRAEMRYFAPPAVFENSCHFNDVSATLALNLPSSWPSDLMVAERAAL